MMAVIQDPMCPQIWMYFRFKVMGETLSVFSFVGDRLRGLTYEATWFDEDEGLVYFRLVGVE